MHFYISLFLLPGGEPPGTVAQQVTFHSSFFTFHSSLFKLTSPYMPILIKPSFGTFTFTA